MFEFITCYLFLMLSNGEQTPLYIWYMYCFPVFRLGDFYIGCCLGKVWKISSIEHLNNSSIVINTFEEIGVMIATIAVYVIPIFIDDSILSKTVFNWTTIYIPIAAAWVWLFAKKRGLITQLLTNSVTIKIGNLSSYAFLIHYVVTRYFLAARIVFNIKLGVGYRVAVIIIEFLISIALSKGYSIIEKKVNSAFYQVIFSIRQLVQSDQR